MQASYNALRVEHGELKASLKEKTKSFEEQKKLLEKSKAQLKTEFENLANNILEEKGESLTKSSKSSIEAVLNPLKEQINAFSESSRIYRRRYFLRG